MTRTWDGSTRRVSTRMGSEMGKMPETFVAAILAGRATIEDIDEYIDRWHSYGPGSECVELHTFLGLSWDEYRAWVADPEFLQSVLADRCTSNQVWTPEGSRQ